MSEIILAFYVTCSPTKPIMLGFPWLCQHDPHGFHEISWNHAELACWSLQCVTKCFRGLPLCPCMTISVESLEDVKPTHIPRFSLDLHKVFSPPCALTYALVMPFGLPNAPAVFQSLINNAFQDMLDKDIIAYIDDILIYSSSFDKHARHVRAMLTCLQRNHLYVNLEKCEFHCTTITFLRYVISQQGVGMDQANVHAITEWPEPTTLKELQCFLGFTNFYWRFIRGYSFVASPLTSLFRDKPKKLVWTEQAQDAFAGLKSSFTTAPVLRHPDLLFIVELDASLGIGVVISQQQRVSNKLHPCAFYSRKLTVAEANYDMGNSELMSIKATLEEWRHWLEGAHHPFLVLADHRNLRGAKELNSRQARSVLFFTRFNFSVTYRPGSKNAKVDTLAGQFETTKPLPDSEPILP